MVVDDTTPVKGTRRPRLVKRIPPSVRLSLLAEELRRNNNVEDLAGELFRLGGRKILQELVEAETT